MKHRESLLRKLLSGDFFYSQAGKSIADGREICYNFL